MPGDSNVFTIYERNRYFEGNYGNVIGQLAKITNKSESEIEKIAESGKSPWRIARECGKFGEFKQNMLESLVETLDNLIYSGCITSMEADERIAEFEYICMTA